MLHWDKSKANTIASPKTDEEKALYTGALLELIAHLKEHKQPAGVNYDKDKVTYIIIKFKCFGILHTHELTVVFDLTNCSKNANKTRHEYPWINVFLR